MANYMKIIERYMREATKEERESVDRYIDSISVPTGVKFGIQRYKVHKLNLDKVNNIDDCKKILKFLCDTSLEPLPEGITYNGFNEVEEYFE